MKTFKSFREGLSEEKKNCGCNQDPCTTYDKDGKMQEAAVDGVAKGSLPDDQHMCATKIFKEGIGEGTPILGEHALPDENGHVSWYKVMFEHGIEVVEVADETVKVLEEGAHGNHKKKK